MVRGVFRNSAEVGIVHIVPTAAQFRQRSGHCRYGIAPYMRENGVEIIRFKFYRPYGRDEIKRFLGSARPDLVG